MISIFNGRSRGLGNRPKKEVHLQVSVEMRKYLRLFSPYDYMVFTAISLHSDCEGISFPSQALLRAETGLNRQTIIAAINRLCGLQIDGKNVLAKRQKPGELGKFGTNEYLLFPTEEDIKSGWNIASPCTVQPDTVQPDTVKPDTKKNQVCEEEPSGEESVVDTVHEPEIPTPSAGALRESTTPGATELDSFPPAPESEFDAVRTVHRQELLQREAEAKRLYEAFRNVRYPKSMPGRWSQAEWLDALPTLRQWVKEGRTCAEVGAITRAAVAMKWPHVTPAAVARKWSELALHAKGLTPPTDAPPVPEVYDTFVPLSAEEQAEFDAQIREAGVGYVR